MVLPPSKKNDSVAGFPDGILPVSFDLEFQRPKYNGDGLKEGGSLAFGSSVGRNHNIGYEGKRFHHTPYDSYPAQRHATTTMEHDGGGDSGFGYDEMAQQGQLQGQQPPNYEAEKEVPRPWSELKTKAGKERKRLPLACIVCRRKKIRCSGEKPACKHCFRSRIPCVYKVTTRKAAPRTDYMAMLDKRLKRMEERVIKIIPKEEPRDMAGIGRAALKPGMSTQTSRPARAAQRKRSADEAFNSELNEWARSNTVTNNEGKTDGDGETPPALQPRAGDENKLLTEGAEYLPAVEIQEHLVEVFFDCIYGQSYLLLHKPSFIRKLKTGAVPPVLILAICAVSARFSTHPQINMEPAFLRGENWANPAASIALSRHDEPNITILTVFLILGLHEFGACHGGRSWSFGGQALRMAYALQLHRELDHDPLGRNNNSSRLSFTDREIRRRTMWACVLMDRYNSSGSQRPPIGNEKFLHIQLPIKEGLFRMEMAGPTESLDGTIPNPVREGVGQLSKAKENMGVSAYIIRGIMLWGRIVDYLNLGGKTKDPYPLWSPESGYASLRKQLDEFAMSLPSSLIFSWENLQNHAVDKMANQFIFLHIVIHQNMLFLNRFAIPLSPNGRPPVDIPKPFLSDAGRAAVEAANHISMLIDQASGYLLTVPFAGYCAYTASTVHIWGIFSKKSQLADSSRENLRHTYSYLNKMKRYWGMFHYMIESTKERYRHFADASTKGISNVGSDREDISLFQYGDWFDKYPHGVSRLHREKIPSTAADESGGDAVMGHKSDLQSVEDFFASLSPPSQADLPRKEQKRRDKSVNDRIRRGNAGNAGNVAQNPKPPQDFVQTQPAPPVQHTAPSMPRQQPYQQQGPAMIDNQLASPDNVSPNHQIPDFTNYHNPSTFPQSNPPFTPDYKFSNNTNSLPELDLQLVYGAYAGLGPITSPIQTSSVNTNPQIAPSGIAHANNPVWNNPNAVEMQGGQNWPGEFSQPGAWFLPFNLDPVAGGLNINTPPQSVDASISTSGMSATGNPYIGPNAILEPVSYGLDIDAHRHQHVMMNPNAGSCHPESIMESGE